MRILSIGNFGRGWDNSICDEEHIAGALEELGHKVVRIQREAFNETGFGQDPEFCDFILVAQWDGYDLRRFEEAQHEFVPIVYWAFDYQADGQQWHEDLIKISRIYLSKRIADYKYPNWQWLSQDFAPAFLGKYEQPISVTDYEQDNSAKKDIDVLFTGSYLDWATERNDTIKQVNEKFNLVVHSVNDWPFLERQPPVMDFDLPQLYARAKIVLSIDHTIEAGYWSDRNAQIMACGRRPMFRYVPLSEARFGDRVEYFYNVRDCLDKIERVLAFPELFYDPPSTDGLYVADRVHDLLTILKGVL